jgi:DNA polymerase I-like protein with 3'-5' exonuclease and polymerase domains
VPEAFPVLACHDELVIECDLNHAERVESWLVGIMLEAATPWLAPVPVEVCASIGTTWGGCEVRAEHSYRRE